MLRESMNVNNTNEIPAFLHDAHSPGEEAAISRQTDMNIKDSRQVSLGTVNVQIQQPKQYKRNFTSSISKNTKGNVFHCSQTSMS